MNDRDEITPYRTPTSWVAAVVADPSISRGTDGRLTLNWDADAPDHCVVHRAALVDLIDEMGRLHDDIDHSRPVLERLHRVRAAGRLALRGDGWDQYQFADAGHLLRWLLAGDDA